MKVITVALSLICICTARTIKWSPEEAKEIADYREVGEQIHKFWSQLLEILDENDEEKVTEFLHQVFDKYRPMIHGSDEKPVDGDMAKPHRPFSHPHTSRPFHDAEEMQRPFLHKDIERPFSHPHISRPFHDAEEMQRPFLHKDIERPIDGASNEIVGQGNERPFSQMHIMRPLEAVSGEISDQEFVRPPFQHKPNKRPTNIDGEIKEFFEQMHILRPLEAVSGEINVQESVRPPFHHKPNERPLQHLAPINVDGEKKEFFEQMHILRPIEAVSGETNDQNIKRPFTYRPNERPPQESAPIEMDGEMEHFYQATIL